MKLSRVQGFHNNSPSFDILKEGEAIFHGKDITAVEHNESDDGKEVLTVITTEGTFTDISPINLAVNMQCADVVRMLKKDLTADEILAWLDHARAHELTEVVSVLE